MDSCQSGLIATALSGCKCMMFHDNGLAVGCDYIEVDYIKVLKPALPRNVDTPTEQLQKLEHILATKAPT